MEFHGATLLMSRPALRSAGATSPTAKVPALRATGDHWARTPQFHQVLAAAKAKAQARPLRDADVPPERLAGAKNLTEPQKIAAASRQFEAVMLRQILTEAQKPVIKSKLTNESASASIYRDLATTQMADQISRSGALGLARLFEQQLIKPEPGSHPATPASP
jgi:peptidoglycan hydrolase FlgJ